MPPPRPAFAGERAALARGKREAFVRKRAKVSFDPKVFLAKVGEGKTISRYRKDQLVFSQGQVADAVFYIQQGKVKLTVVSEQGKEAVVAILAPCDFFGEGCLNGHPLRLATTRAIEECVITRLEKATMIAALHNQPEFSELFMSYLLARNGRIEEDLIDQLFNSSEKRLARILLLLANFGKEGRPEPIVGKFSQETLAEMIGTTRSRVSFFMNKFRKLGFIEYNGQIEVHNSLVERSFVRQARDQNEGCGQLAVYHFSRATETAARSGQTRARATRDRHGRARHGHPRLPSRPQRRRWPEQACPRT